MQSPFHAHASHPHSASAEGDDRFDTAGVSTKDRQDVGTEQGSHRFDAVASTAATGSDDTAHRRPDPAPSILERHSSFFVRGSRNMSRLSKRFNDSRAASSETVKMAQEQQQTNRQNAAPVLKAVPSTRVGMSSLSAQACQNSEQSSDSVISRLSVHCIHIANPFSFCP